MIDWSKLKPYQGFKWKSFEEFCYQIAKGLYEDEGRFTPIDDTGGGDGVEFYFTLSDGREWGWQAKFYHPNKRLTSSRKRDIRESLDRSIRNHRRLEKWFLCTPTNFTPLEKEWFDELQKNYANVILEHWGASDFNYFLRTPHLIGIKSHFFGELELSIEWFYTQVEKQISNVKHQFNPNLHTETIVDFGIHALLGDSSFREYLKEQLANLNGLIEKFDEATEELCETETKIDWKDTRDRLLAYSTELKTNFLMIKGALVDFNGYLSTGQFGQIERIDWNLMEAELKEKIDDYYRTARDFEQEKLPYSSTDKEQENAISYIRQKIYEPIYAARQIASSFYGIKNSLEQISQQELHIFGGAGFGKTHIACHICKERISNGLPAILMLGKHITSDSPLEQQILRILDVPHSYSWKDFAKALQSAAEAYKTKIPIVIDALNEAQTVKKLKNELSGFVYTLSNLSQVALITTCRSSYQQEIWDPLEPKNAIKTYGFGSASLENAIVKYFDWYKLKCDMTLAPLRQFSHPIFLKIFCESQNRERRVEKQIYLGEQTLLQIFEDYITKCNEAVCLKLSRRSSVSIVQVALKKFAAELWKRKSQQIPLADVVELIDSTDMIRLDWLNSVTHAILDEGLLIDRDMIKGEEVVLFTYKLLGGYMIAKEVIDGLTSEKVEEFANSKEFETYLLSHDFSDRHPLHEDILRCFALLLPMKFGKHLYQFTKDKTAFNYSIFALFEMAPDLIDTSSKELIIELFARPENRKRLLKLAQSTVAHVGHPLNIEFWHKLLFELSMPERDLSWTEFVRRNTSVFFRDLDNFEIACKESKNLANISKQRLSLAAWLCRWLLTSTVRPLRDTATRALYWYGRLFPNEFFDLVLSSLSINDPYVPERMLAAAYGVAMALQYDFQKPDFRGEILPIYAKKLYEAMFKSDAPYATTHILSRDYANRLIDIALIHSPDLLTSEEKKRTAPPFVEGGIRSWGESEDRDKGSYREGSGPIHPDFANYTLGHLVPNRGPYDFSHEDYKKVRANIFWRLYDLGYSHDLFKEIDKEIHRHNWRFGRAATGDKIDRYGKKYSWVAFYELAGFRQDNALLSKYHSEISRIYDADIDPSFPESPQKCYVIKADYLGNRSSSVTEWIENGGVADLHPYLIIEELCNEHGPWVLLDGYVNQEDLEVRRVRFIFPRGLLVKKNEAPKLVGCLKNRNLRERRLPDIPEDYYTYAGEIPWCDTFPYNGKTEIDFVVGTRKERVSEKGVAKLRDGTVLTKSELLDLFLQRALDLPRSLNKDTVKALLSREGIEQTELEIYRDKDIKEITSFEVLMPVRYYNWESYHSTVNRAGSAMVPAREIAEALDLCSQPQTFDLYEKDGKRASVTLRWGEPWHTQHRLIYLRQDLLERYLKENDAELVWAVRGERQFRSEEIKELEEFSKEHKSFKVFQTTKTYTDVKKDKTGCKS